MRLWEATDKAFAASDAFMDAHLTPRDPKERPLFLGLGRWRALRDLGRVREDWKHLADTSQARDRWVDEWQDPKAVLDPAARLDQSATKTVGLLRMLESYAGEAVVDKSLEGLPVKFEDFYARLRARSERPLPEWDQFSLWLTQVGLPMLESKVDGHRLVIEQSGFTLYPDEDLHNQQNRWPLPLVIRFRDKEGIKTQRALLLPDQTEVRLEARGTVDWADVNGSGMGWFRTHLPESERLALLKDLPKLDLAEQTNFQINQWRLVRHGSEPVGKFYDSLLATPIQDSEWLNLLLYEMGTQQNWAYPEDRPAFHRFLADLARSAVSKSGVEYKPSDPPELSYQKAIFRHWLANVGDDRAQQAARAVAEHYQRTGEVVRGLETSADSQLLALLESKTRDGFRQGKVPAEADCLVYWPDLDGSFRLINLLQEPESRLSDQDRTRMWRSMGYSTPALDALWSSLTSPHQPVPHPEQLAGLLATGPYRSRMDKMPAPLRDKIQSLGGSAKTMANISDQIHEFLVRRGYLLALARLPFTERVALLGDTLRVTMPEGSEVEGRAFDVMAAPEPDEAETRVVVVSGQEELVLMSQQFHALAGPDFAAEVNSVLKGWEGRYLTTPGKTEGGLSCVFVREEGAEKGTEEANLLESMFVKNVDGTVQYLAVYLNPTACKEWDDLAPIVHLILRSVGPGSKRVDLGERTIELDRKLGLSVKVPAGMMTATNQASDFVVLRCYPLRPLGSPSDSLFMYLGCHPNFSPKADAARTPGRLLGQEVEWRAMESRGSLKTVEALVRVPAGQEKPAGLLISGDQIDYPDDAIHAGISYIDEKSLDELKRVAESLSVNSSAPAYQPMEMGESLSKRGRYRAVVRCGRALRKISISPSRARL